MSTLQAFPGRAAGALAAALLLGAACGCGRGSDSLSGTVRLEGRPVAHALVVLIGPDGRQAVGTTNASGDYVALNPPRGRCQVTVTPSLPPVDAAQPQGVRVPPPAGETATSTPIPPKYGQPGNGLEVDVASGAQTFNIVLTR